MGPSFATGSAYFIRTSSQQSSSMAGCLRFLTPLGGCPLSPLLYVFSIEVLAECIRASPNIEGVTIPHSVEGYKCSGYADNTIVAVTTEQSIEETFSVYSTYERASGAKLNRGKSKAMWAGSWKDRTDTHMYHLYLRSVSSTGQLWMSMLGIGAINTTVPESTSYTPFIVLGVDTPYFLHFLVVYFRCSVRLNPRLFLF